jgi:nicotinamidase-related amidase
MKIKPNQLIYVFLIAAILLPSVPAIADQPEGATRALLVIDIQEDCTGKILKPPFLFQKQSEDFIPKVNRIITDASLHNTVIVYLRTNFKMQDVPGAQLDARLKVVGTNCFLKDSFDAFSSSNHQFTDFLEFQKQIKEFYLLGLDATLCVYQTAKAAVEKGYSAVVLSDAILTVSGKTKEQIEQMYEKASIKVMTTDDFLDSLQGQ